MFMLPRHSRLCYNLDGMCSLASHRAQIKLDARLQGDRNGFWPLMATCNLHRSCLVESVTSAEILVIHHTSPLCFNAERR